MMENSERLGLYAFERIFGPDGKRPGTADQERAWALVQLRKDRGRLPADLKSDRGEGNTRRATLAAALLAMPDVGVDADFARVNDPDSGDKL